MVPVVADPHISEFSALAVQEPRHNRQILTTHNPSNSSFHSYDPPSAEVFICFLSTTLWNPALILHIFKPQSTSINASRALLKVSEMSWFTTFTKLKIFPQPHLKLAPWWAPSTWYPWDILFCFCCYFWSLCWLFPAWGLQHQPPKLGRPQSYTPSCFSTASVPL